MLDSDLAGLYQVTTGNLNLAVTPSGSPRSTNRPRRPATPPYAFTEHGVAISRLCSTASARCRDMQTLAANVSRELNKTEEPPQAQAADWFPYS